MIGVPSTHFNLPILCDDRCVELPTLDLLRSVLKVQNITIIMSPEAHHFRSLLLKHVVVDVAGP